jgi:hypothetical protein
MMTFALYFILGFLFKAFVDGIKATSAATKIKKDNEQKYKQVLRRIRKGKSTFKTRVNNTVYIGTTLHETGDVDVILFLDTKKVAIFQNNACLHTSDAINEELKNEIVKEIEEKYAVEIEDVVELLGNKISRKEVDDKINDILNTKIEDLFQFPSDSGTQFPNSTEKQEGAYTQEDVDAIFDKIAKSGMTSISEDEKKILDDYSKNLK